jgi:hypothetical protein
MEHRDPALGRIRQARHEISERFDHDPDALVAHYMELDKRYADRLWKAESEELTDPALHHEAA